MTREEKIALLKQSESKAAMSREQKIALLKNSESRPTYDPTKIAANARAEGQQAMRTAGDALLFGYQPEIMAGVIKGGNMLSDLVTGGDTSALSYTDIRDQIYKENEAKKKEMPVASAVGTVAGTVAQSVPVGKALQALGVAGKGATMLGRVSDGAKTGAVYGAVTNPGAESGNVDPLQIKERLMNAGLGALFGAGTQFLVEGARAVPATGRALRGFAEKAAENATGATRVQAEKFAPGAGRELLDRKIVKFGSSPGDIAQNAEKAMAAAESQLDDVLKTLDLNRKISPDDVLAAIDDRITILKTDPSTAPQAKQLEAIRADIAESMAGQSQLPSTVEQWKRGYGKNTNWNDPEKALARKEAYGALQESVEDSASSMSGDTGARFEEAKRLWGLLKPIREAAEKRALQQSQHPVVGLNDMMAAGGGLVAGDPTLGVGTAVARRLIAPRVSSSVAVTADKIGKLLTATPEKFGKFAAPLQQAMQKSPQAFQATVYMLSKNPEFKKVAMEDNPGTEPVLSVKERQEKFLESQ